MPISSLKSRRPRSRLYSIGSGPKVDAYTSAIASINEFSRSSSLPVFGTKRLLYLPEKAAPKLSSRRLDDLIIIGCPSKSRIILLNPSTISLGNVAFLKTCSKKGCS